MTQSVKLLLAALCWMAPLLAEAIPSFHVDLSLNQDGSAQVTENSSYVLPLYPPKRGMLRFIQTRYQGILGTRFFTPLSVSQVLRDGHPEPFSLIPVRRGLVIRTGSKDQFIVPGIHQFGVSYRLEHVVRFSPTGEELYWQVTGTSSRIPIQQASITVHPPKNGHIDPQTCYLYYGDPNQSTSTQRCNLLPDGSVQFQAPDSIQPGEGMSISLLFPPGTFKQPTTLLRLARLFYDNSGLLILLLGLIISWVLTLLRWFHVRKNQNSGIIIPLFAPPDQLLPSECGYITTMHNNNKQFAAELVNLAIEGFITIELINKTWSLHREYKLKRTAKDISLAKATHQELLTKLLPQGMPTLSLSPNVTTDRAHLRDASEYLARSLRKKHSSLLFRYDLKGLLYSFVLPLFFLFCSFIATFTTTIGGFRIEDDPLLLVLALLFAPLIFAAFFMFHIYTPAGCTIRDKIKGFRLFLTTTETKRLEVIGTPPVKTPELFEKYLPFAIALNAEKAWTKQFASVFDTLSKSASPYTPLWLYGGTDFVSSIDQLSQFNSDLNHFVADTKAFTSSSSSGSNGKGSSGGGFGGGGIGSW